MSIKLKLLLFYLKHFVKNDLHLPPHIIRKENTKQLPTYNRILDYDPEELPEVRDEQIEVRDGSNIPARIYIPSSDKKRPLIMYYHGGGFVLRSIDSHDRVCRRLSKMNNAVVVSVGYRLAPEYKFPIPHQDCYDATLWAVKNADDFNSDNENITVMGDSAGANLASVVSLIAKSSNGPKISNQVLIYPCCDSSKTYETEIKYGKDYFLTKERMDWFTDHYINRPEEKLDPYVSPVLSKELENMPKTLLITAEYDPLKGEGIAFADKLKEAGNDVKYIDYSGVIHGFFNMPKICKECMVANQDIKEFLAYS